jgi:hypothetical protein
MSHRYYNVIINVMEYLDSLPFAATKQKKMTLLPVDE